mmetsp:Transcript_64369/g.172315  ORF Transcript_64369/g.172315 Transcript_64369/m.172315 type:complete len:293 (+) Transcript_64369:299-1177(+)
MPQGWLIVTPLAGLRPLRLRPRALRLRRVGCLVLLGRRSPAGLSLPRCRGVQQLRRWATQVAYALLPKMSDCGVNVAGVNLIHPVRSVLDELGDLTLHAVHTRGSGVSGFLQRGPEQSMDLNDLLLECSVSINRCQPFRIHGRLFERLFLLLKHLFIHLDHSCCIVSNSLRTVVSQHRGGVDDLQRRNNLFATCSTSKRDGLQLSMSSCRRSPPTEYQSDPQLVHILELVLCAQIHRRRWRRNLGVGMVPAHDFCQCPDLLGELLCLLNCLRQELRVNFNTVRSLVLADQRQ